MAFGLNYQKANAMLKYKFMVIKSALIFLVGGNPSRMLVYHIPLIFFLFQNLTKEQADYCINRMKPYQDKTGRSIPDTYDFIDFTRSLFIN